MNLRSLSTLIFISFILCFQLSSQSLFVRKISVEDGLIGYDNYQTLVDKKGNVWVASENGIIKFFGAKHLQFTVKQGLLTNDNWRLDLDSKNRIWLNNYNPGIQYIENDKVKTVEGSLNFNEIYFAGDHGDTVFFSVLESGRLKRYFFANDNFGYYNPFNFNGYEIKADYREHGFLLLTKENSKIDFIYSLANRTIRKLTYQVNSLSSANLRDTDIGAYTNDERSKFLVIPKKLGFKEKNFNQLFGSQTFERIHQVGKYLILKRFSSFELYEANSSFIRAHAIETMIKENLSDSINFEGISVDHQNNIWLLEERGELSFIHNNARWAKHIHFSNYLDRNQALLDPLPVPNSNLVLFRNYRNEIYSIDKKTFRTKLVLSSSSIVHMRIRGNRLFILMPRELHSYEFSIQKGAIDVLEQTKKILNLNKNAYSFCFLNSSSILLANGQKIRIGKNHEFVVDPSVKLDLPFRTISLMYKDSLLVYNSSAICGYYDFKNKKQGHFNIENPNSITIDGNNILIGTRGSGFYLVNRKNMNKLTSKHFEYTISKIITGNNGLYFCTDKGLFFAKILEKNSISIQKAYLTQKWFSIDVSNAILGENFLLLTNRGFIELNDHQYDLSREKLSNFQVSISSSGKKFSQQPITFPYHSANVSFALTNLSFFDISQTVFRYRLVGYNENWQFSENKTIDYPNLEPGHYVFEVESSDNYFGNFSNLRRIEFEIEQPFYFQWKYIIFMIILLILLILLTTYIVNYYSTRKAKTKQLLKELELKALRAQLTPHFVFNSLNAIQSALILKGQREANDYITAFATLIRKVLNNSRSEKISLTSELNFLKNYIELENHRLKFPIHFSIHLSPSINTDSIMIYVMVFQPIIENAILHGFTNKDIDKQLTMNFELVNDLLITTIYDNGIGIEVSKKTSKERNHESLASSILEEKSHLLNSLRKEELEISVDELGANEKGTRIIVKMRVEIKNTINQ